MPMQKFLPEDFLWGAATSAHQVEGHQHNNWSVWEDSVAGKLVVGAEKRLKGEVLDWPAIKTEATNPKNYISGDAADHYNRFHEDFDILQKLGCNAYRFSVEWSRVEPEPDKYDEAALDHYADMVSELKKRRIEPLVTLHHFTDPVWLEGCGGWHGKETPERFGKFSEQVVRKLGKEVIYWSTINEPGSYLLERYLGGGAWPQWPIITMNPANGYRYLKNVVKAHKLAREAVKSVNPEAQVGINHALIDYQLGRRDPLSFALKKGLDYIPDTYLLKRLKDEMDYIGVNYYMRSAVKVGLSSPQTWAQKCVGSDPQNDMGWGIYPEGIYNVTQKVKKYGLPILITENGIPDAADTRRAQFIRDHIDALKRSRADGADIRGYFYWSLLDNYEWSEGFWPKFGLVAVSRENQKRTVRRSAEEYAKIISQHRSRPRQF